MPARGSPGGLEGYYTTPPADRPQYLATLARQAEHDAKPRMVRALLDMRALLDEPADPVLGLVSCALAGLWYWWRRSTPGLQHWGGVFRRTA